MKILHILNELRPSGAEVMLMLSTAEWPKYGVTAEILSTGATPGEYAPTLQQAGWTVHHLPFRKSPAFFFELSRFLRREGYDAVHIHAERAFPYFALTAKVAGISCIVRTIHSAFTFSGSLRRRRALQRKLLARMGVVSTSVSKSVQQNEREHLSNETVQVPNWYNSTYFVPPTELQRSEARQELGIVQSEFILISVSNCAPVKNHKGILEALTMLPSTLKFRYFHIGHGLQETAEREFVNNNGLAEKVVFAGQQSDVRKYLWAADCFLMPSLYEGIGISAMEALSTGLPTILTDVIGLRDFKEWCKNIVWTGVSGESIAEGILIMLKTSKTLLRELALDDSVLIPNIFNMQASVKTLVSIYACKPIL
ncbi:MAG: glycosyltransferase [Acidobacteria bacterium]|nr:glycosyltransferase [Acidobacteriota bacterium]MBW4043985.1 glycosyltransferase [Acidobacteriota bacterium]